jgi:hypothetical protein
LDKKAKGELKMALKKKNKTLLKNILIGVAILTVLALIATFGLTISGVGSSYYVGDVLSFSVNPSGTSITPRDCSVEIQVYDGSMGSEAVFINGDENSLGLNHFSCLGYADCYKLTQTYTLKNVGEGSVRAKMTCKEAWVDGGWVAQVNNFPSSGYWVQEFTINSGQTLNPKDHKACYNGEIYWFDESGVRTSSVDICSLDAPCRMINGVPTCTKNSDSNANYVAHASKACSGNWLYYYDSNSQRSDLIKDCGAQKCVTDACVDNSYTEVVGCKANVVLSSTCDSGSFAQIKCSADGKKWERNVDVCSQGTICDSTKGCVAKVVDPKPDESTNKTVAPTFEETCSAQGGVVETVEGQSVCVNQGAINDVDCSSKGGVLTAGKCVIAKAPTMIDKALTLLKAYWWALLIAIAFIVLMAYLIFKK